MANSSKKGKRGERDFCHALHDLGYAARRSEQNNGSVPDGWPDVLTDLDPKIYFEVKRREAKLWHQQVRDWLEKARNESPDSKDTVLAWRPNHCPEWLCFVPAEIGVENDFKIFYGTEPLIEYYDPEGDLASLKGKDNPHEHRHKVKHSDWI